MLVLRAPRVGSGSRRRCRRADGGPRPRRIGGLALRGYLDVVVPFAILVTMPGFLGAGWPVLIRTDIGLVLAVIAGLRVADGAIRVVALAALAARG